MAAKVEGMAALRQRILKTLPDAAKKKIAAANEKNATEFRDLVAQIIPRGDPRAPNLIDTLEMRPGDKSETAFLVTIGGPEAPYPLHLEGGHRTADGVHVPATPYWNPAKVVLKKRAKRRSATALREAVQITAAGQLGTT